MTGNAQLQLEAEQSDDRIHRLFWPDSVAIVGASRKGGFVTEILKNLKKWSFAGEIAAVNPRYGEIEGVRCYPSIGAIGRPVGLAIVGVPSGNIPDVLADCGNGRVGAIQIISSGFADQGDEGRAKQARLAEWAARTGVPIAGPNCLGLLNAANGLVALQTPFQSMKAGGVSAVLQSGMLAPSLLMPLLARGIGIGRVVTTGNEADLDAADFIEHLVDDEETRVIACYCEQFKRPREFVRACERAAERGKPIVMIKVGRSEASRRSALAHTGSLVGSDVAVDAVLRKLGVVRVDTIDELVETAAALSAAKKPRGGRVAFVSFSGGAVSLLADLAEPCGIDFTPLPDDVRQRLDAVVPEYGSVGNPLDLTGQSVYEPRILEEALSALGSSGAYDVVLWGRDFPSPLDLRGTIGTAMRKAGAGAPDVLFGIMGMVGGNFFATPDPASDMADPAVSFDGMPFLQGTGTGLKALSALIGHAEFARRWRPENRISSQWDRRSPHCDTALRMLAQTPGPVLTEREGKHLLALYGIPVTREALARSPQEAMRIAGELRLPLVLKVEAPEIVHKSDVGGVVLDVRSPEDAAQAYRRIVEAVAAHRPDASVAGVLVQEMAAPGSEVILGAKFDPQFGPVIAFGLGGIWVEALKDLQVLVPPISRSEALEAIARLRGISILQGARGGAPADIDALADCITGFARMCSDLTNELDEIDINPIMLGSRGTGLTAVDCLIVRKQQAKELE